MAREGADAGKDRIMTRESRIRAASTACVPATPAAATRRFHN
jgi:hypothetical protein